MLIKLEVAASIGSKLIVPQPEVRHVCGYQHWPREGPGGGIPYQIIEGSSSMFTDYWRIFCFKIEG